MGTAPRGAAVVAQTAETAPVIRLATETRIVRERAPRRHPYPPREVQTRLNEHGSVILKPAVQTTESHGTARKPSCCAGRADHLFGVDGVMRNTFSSVSFRVVPWFNLNPAVITTKYPRETHQTRGACGRHCGHQFGELCFRGNSFCFRVFRVFRGSNRCFQV